MFYSRHANKRKRLFLFRWVKRAYVYTFLALLLSFVLLIFGVVVYYKMRADNYDINEVVKPLNANYLFDASLSPIARLDGKKCIQIKRADLPPHLVNALIAREDENFFSHQGIEYAALMRSLWRNIKEMRFVQGGSTISMQLTRNVYELRGKTIDRKLLEMALTQRVEEVYDKDTILTQYLNRIYFGNGCYGIANAAHYYFNKSVKELDLVESACLVGLIRGPSLFNPRTSMEKAMVVKEETLLRMLELGMIDEARCNAAILAPIVLSPKQQEKAANYYPAMLAKKKLAQIEDEAGKRFSSVSIVSSMDAGLQFRVEEFLEQSLNVLENPRLALPSSWFEGLNEAEQKSLLPKLAKLRQGMTSSKGLDGAVLVINTRGKKHASLMAYVGGRHVIPGKDVWHDLIEPGQAAASLLFAASYQSASPIHYFEVNDMKSTGRKLGYELVHSYYKSLALLSNLPDKEEQDKLFAGDFSVSAMNLARIQFAILSGGNLYDFSLIDEIKSQQGQTLYQRKVKKEADFIRRECAQVLRSEAPFIAIPGRQTKMNLTLPHGQGQWALSYSGNGMCVFVYIKTEKTNKKLLDLLSISAPLIVNEIRRMTVESQQMKSS